MSNSTILNLEIPLWQKTCLTLDEAAVLTGIGINRLRKASDSTGELFTLWVGKKRLLKRVKLLEYIDAQYSL